MAEVEKSTNGSADLDAKDKKIIRQLEYYFGDCNLSRDSFMQEEIKKDDGWITFETMTNFKRLASISDDVKVLGETMSKYKGTILQMNDERSKIRRNPESPILEFTKELRDAMALRSIYAKGFPLDATLDDLEEFFDQFGTIENVFMRKNKPKHNTFKGSVFVQFQKEEEAKKFMGLESVKYKETELIRFTKNAYNEKKTEELNQAKEQRKKDKLKKEENRMVEQVNSVMKKNAVLSLKNVPTDSQYSELKEYWEKYGSVRFADYKTGQETAFIRFANEDSATKALEAAKSANDNKIIFKDVELEVTMLEGDEEQTYWKKFVETQNSSMQKNAVLLLKNLPDGTGFQDLKSFWGKYGPVSYVEHSSGKPTGNVRFDGCDTALPALESAKKDNDGKVMFKETEIEVSLLEGEEEIAYWQSKSRKRQGGHGGPRSKRGRFRR